MNSSNSQPPDATCADTTAGTLIFAEIPKLPESWWTDPPTSDPASVWTVWDRDTYYTWGANVGNYQVGTIGSVIGGGGMAGSRGPTRGRHHPHYPGIITMNSAEMPKNKAVFTTLGQLVAQGKNVVIPVYNADHTTPPQLRFSLGTGIGASQPNWDAIQTAILTDIYNLGQTCGSVKIPAGTYWPDCRTAKPYKRHPITDLADIKNIIDNVL